MWLWIRRRMLEPPRHVRLVPTRQWQVVLYIPSFSKHVVQALYMGVPVVTLKGRGIHAGCLVRTSPQKIGSAV